MTTRIIIRTVDHPSRKWMLKYLTNRLPTAEICVDSSPVSVTDGKARSTLTFLKALGMAGDDPVVHIEDDVVLTCGFVEKMEAAIRMHPTSIVQMFSMRSADVTVGSRWDRKFMMNQCFYTPARYSALLKLHIEQTALRMEHPGGYDMMMAEWLNQRREPYWIHCPSLVEHRIARSLADSRRSSRRQSKTFVDPWV